MVFVPRPRANRMFAILAHATWAIGVVTSVAAAQPAPAFGPSMTFIGGGVGVTSSGAQGRVQVTAFPERSLVAPRLEAGLALGRRVGLGLAFVPFAEIDGSHNIARLAVSDRQREQAWVAELRVRTSSTSRAPLDLVAGAGLLRQQREGQYTAATCGVSCFTTVMADPGRTSPVFTAGVDIPVRLGAHVSVAAVARVFWMRRGLLDVQTWPRDNTTEVAAFLTLRFTR